MSRTASEIANEICGCADRAQHLRDIALIEQDRADARAELRRKLDEAVKLLECWKVWSCGQNGQSPFFETKEWLSSISQID